MCTVYIHVLKVYLHTPAHMQKTMNVILTIFKILLQLRGFV